MIIFWGRLEFSMLLKLISRISFSSFYRDYWPVFNGLCGCIRSARQHWLHLWYLFLKGCVTWLGIPTLPLLCYQRCALSLSFFTCEMGRVNQTSQASVRITRETTEVPQCVYVCVCVRTRWARPGCPLCLSVRLWARP